MDTKTPIIHPVIVLLHVKSCPDLVTPMNGYKDSNDTSCDSVVTFSCDSCYDLVGYSQLTCLPNHTWSSDEPVCSNGQKDSNSTSCDSVVILKSCPDLETPMNGHKDSNSRSCDSVVTFSCDACYDLVGYSRLICLCACLTILGAVILLLVL
jgi:hypothetical protein